MYNKPKIILGIDPGTVIMGYGLIAVHQNKLSLVDMGVLKLSPKLDAYQRLEKIHLSVTELIQKFKPQSFAIEAPFFGKNVQSMLKLGRAQGVAIAAAMQARLPVCEYSPKKVKQAITGNGNASKEQVMKMLHRMIEISNQPQYYDATDALSVAVCHYYQQSAVIKTSGNSENNWEAFIRKNPQRIKG